MEPVGAITQLVLYGRKQTNTAADEVVERWVFWICI